MSICRNTSYAMDWWPFQAKQYRISSLPHPENVHPWSINNFWSFQSGNYKVTWWWLDEMDAMAVIIA